MNNTKKLTAGQLFQVFLKLGLTSFGGPVAHLGYFRAEFVTRRRCLDDGGYADLVALCQFLPGPASSQVGIGIGISQAGLWGGVVAWAGFTLPSALVLILFASVVTSLQGAVVEVGWLHGLKVVAVAVVAQAIVGMAKSLCPDRPRAAVAILAATLALSWSDVAGQLAAIGLGALFGLLFLRSEEPLTHETNLFTLGKKAALISFVIFLGLFFVLPLLALDGAHTLALIDSFYRSGALVFGGGHVVLPLLQAEVIGPGWVSKDLFLAGYGAAQAVPGPLFTFSAYLGTVSAGWLRGLFCLLAIYLPSFLLLVGILPFWNGLRKQQRVRDALLGVNAAVVGLLLAAFYDPVWKSGILSASDFALAVAAFLLLALWRLPPWFVVGGTALGGALVGVF